MSTITQYAAKLISPARIEYYPEAASQSFKKGEFVYLVSGKVTVCTTTTGKIAGMAMQDASGTTDTSMAVALAEEGVLFEMNHTTTTAITQVGACYGLTVTSNKHYVNAVTTVGLMRFRVKALSPRDAAGDTYGRLLVEVIGSLCQLSGQTS